MISRIPYRIWLYAIHLCFAIPSRVFAAHCSDTEVMILEPLTIGGFSGHQCITIDSGANTFLNYFNGAVDWILTVAFGFCVIWVVIGGFMIMTSGGDGSKRTEGFEKIKWAIVGLTLLLFAGFILNTLNDVFFTM